MADNNELKTARMSNNSPGSLIDNHLANVEAALATIFGITQDSDCENAMTISPSGDITMVGTLTLAADPTTDLQIATKQYVDNNTSTAATVRCQVKRTAGQTFTTGVPAAVSWQETDFEEGGDCWAIGSPTRLIAPDAGEYLISCNLQVSAQDLASVSSSYATLKRNGTAVVEGIWGINNFVAAAATGAEITITTLESCDAGDYFEVFVTAVNRNHVLHFTYSKFSIVKVG